MVDGICACAFGDSAGPSQENSACRYLLETGGHQYRTAMYLVQSIQVKTRFLEAETKTIGLRFGWRSPTDLFGWILPLIFTASWRFFCIDQYSYSANHDALVRNTRY